MKNPKIDEILKRFTMLHPRFRGCEPELTTLTEWILTEFRLRGEAAAEIAPPPTVDPPVNPGG